MSKKKGGFSDLLYGSIMPKIYGIGAAIVIVGAMFKILHLEGGGLMLGIGLTTEAIIFFLSAFEPRHQEPDWSLVYPELAGEAPVSRKAIGAKGDSTTKKLDAMLESSKVGPELIDSLGRGMKNLSESVAKMSDLSNAAVATNDYANNVQQASKSLIDMNKSYATTVTAMNDMAGASVNAKEYHSQVQTVTKNLASLNAVYEMELQDANSHLKSMNKFYANLSSAMDNVSEASKDAEKFKNNFSSLNGNIASLNTVYGNMLTAMRA